MFHPVIDKFIALCFGFFFLSFFSSSSAVKEDPFQIQGQAKNEHRKKNIQKFKSQAGVFPSSGMMAVKMLLRESTAIQQSRTKLQQWEEVIVLIDQQPRNSMALRFCGVIINILKVLPAACSLDSITTSGLQDPKTRNSQKSQFLIRKWHQTQFKK